MADRLIITVLGADHPGIVAGVTTALAHRDVNILDLSSTKMRDLFVMLLLAELPEGHDLATVRDAVEATGEALGVQVLVQHEDIFRYMHRV